MYLPSKGVDADEALRVIDERENLFGHCRLGKSMTKSRLAVKVNNQLRLINVFYNFYILYILYHFSYNTHHIFLLTSYPFPQFNTRVH